MTAQAIRAAEPVAPPQSQTFVVSELGDLLATTFPPRDELLSPMLHTQSLAMVHAWRGIGKTHFALNIAYAIASGGQYLSWKAALPRKVLYIDGEMPGPAVQTRLAKIVESAQAEAPLGYFRILTPDQQEWGVTPNLASPEGQESINELIEDDTALIVVDNLSALVRGAGRENDAESWEAVGTWAMQLRACGHSVLFVHHSGKNGAQRGTSKREDILDLVLALKRPDGYKASEGARFEIHFEKARHLMGVDVDPVEATLGTDANGQAAWTWRAVEDATIKRAAELKRVGASQKDICEELDLSRWQVKRLLTQAEDTGLIDSAAFSRGGKRHAMQGSDHD